jgi:hypothetical protein
VENGTDLAHAGRGGTVPPAEHRFTAGAGWSGNPGGRPKLARPPSVALAELNDTPGTTLDDVITNYRAARGAKLCAADLKAIAAFVRDSSFDPVGVSAFNSSTDRLEGKVAQRVELDANVDLTTAIAVAAKAARE